MSKLPMQEWVDARKAFFDTLKSNKNIYEKTFILGPIIEKHPDAKEWQDKKEKRALHIALARNDLDLFIWLIDAGFSLRQSSKYRDFLDPFRNDKELGEVVARSGKREFIIAYLERGGSVWSYHAKTTELKDLIESASQIREDFLARKASPPEVHWKPVEPPSLEEDRKKFFAAIKTDNADVVEKICRRHKSACDWHGDKGEAAIFGAIAAKSMQALKKLADMGADLEAESKRNSHRPLYRAVYEENIDAVHLLVERGAKTGVPLEGFLSYNYPIDLAASKKNHGMLDILRNARQIRQDYLASTGQLPPEEPPKPQKQPRIKKSVAGDLVEKFNALSEKVETLQKELADAKKRIQELESPAPRTIDKNITGKPLQ